MTDWRKRKFKNGAALRRCLKEAYKEERVVKVLQKRRPLRKGDKIFRCTVVIDGKAFWRSVVIRADGSIEFWMKRYIDADTAVHKTTHEGFELVAHLQPKDH